MGRGVLGANLTWEESSACIEILSVVKKWGLSHAAGCWDLPHVSGGCWSWSWSSFPVLRHLSDCQIMCRRYQAGAVLEAGAVFS